MKAAIYDRYWASMGGGERHSAMIAQILSRTGVEVDLIGHTEVSLEILGSRLALDLSRTRMRVVPDRGEDDVAELSAEYDLFINATYMSRICSQATRSAFLCFFPTPVDHDHSPLGRAAIRFLGPHVQLPERIHHFHYGTGWYPVEGGRRRQWGWNNGEAMMVFEAGPEHAITADFGRPGTPGPIDLEITTADGDTLSKFTVDNTFRRQTIVIPPSTTERTITFRSETFTPVANDSRELGVAMSRLKHRGARMTMGERIGIRYPWLRRDPQNFDYLSSYDVVLANSAYTQEWIRRLWRVESEILFPPIEITADVPAVERARTILSVGRLFAPEYGHSKRQLEMVQMFGRLMRSGQLDGWKFVIIGGCEAQQEPYLNQVRAAAAGLPVDIHVNASRGLVEEHMRSASIFWSATGMGADGTKRPWESEHFGMTTAEAMAGGCVPVVIDQAGQQEIVRQGVDGFRWRDESELRVRTVQVATDEILRARMAASAAQRAREFSDESFAARWTLLADENHLLAPPPSS